MKKRVLFACLLVIVVISSSVYAEDANSQAKIDKAYQCIQDQIKTKSTLSLQDAVFGVLALGADSKTSSVIDSEKKANEFCWPKASCAIKDTAQVLMAYDRTGKDSKGIKDWLLSKVINEKDLTWYLEIDTDNHAPSECTLTYDSGDHKISIKEDMTLTGSPGSCFEISYGGYWLKIKDQCLDKQFDVSCDDSNQGNFITTLVYQKKAGGTVYVSSDTHSSAKGGTTSEKVDSKCFSTANKCDYEGTLWAAMALSKQGENVKSYIPYLLTLSDDNQKYLPSSFLYILTAGDDSYADLIQKQKGGKYWDNVGSPYNRYYDSALALLALAGANSAEAGAAKDYFLTVQTTEGCWNNNNIRDTGFLLFAAWPKSVGGGGGTGGGGADCVSANYFCEPRNDCLGVGGTTLDNFQCTNFAEACCTKKVLDATCDEKGGLICSSNQQCSGTTERAADGSCCVGGACQEIPAQNVCAATGGSCQTSCLSTEEETGSACPITGDVCCVQGTTPVKTGGNWTWAIIIGVLIIIIVILIIYRRKLQMWWHSRKKGREGNTGPRGPPGGPGPRYGMASPRMMPRYGAPVNRGPAPTPRVTRGVKSPQDKEMEETMRKLKEMSG